MRYFLSMLLTSCVFIASCSSSSVNPELAFIFQDTTDISEIHCYHLHPWSDTGEIHSGIDISPKYSDLIGTNTIKTSAVIAPSDGVVERILEHESGAGAKMYSVVIKINDYWRVIMSFEPQSIDAEVVALQAESILVSEGSSVKKGQKIADLVYGRLITDHYPHIHFSVLYIKPGDSLDAITANIDNVPRNNGIPTPPPRTGASSPWEPSDLGLDSHFFCPYLYFSDAAQAILDSVPRYSVTGALCSCMCAYNSANGDCGDCAP